MSEQTPQPSSNNLTQGALEGATAFELRCAQTEIERLRLALHKIHFGRTPQGYAVDAQAIAREALSGDSPSAPQTPACERQSRLVQLLDAAHSAFQEMRLEAERLEHDIGRALFHGPDALGFTDETSVSIPARPYPGDEAAVRQAGVTLPYCTCAKMSDDPHKGGCPFWEAILAARKSWHDRNLVAWSCSQEAKGQQRCEQWCGYPELCTAVGTDRRKPSARETSTDGWKCVTCGQENPRGLLRCQNPKCTVLIYSPENGKGDGS